MTEGEHTAKPLKLSQLDENKSIKTGSCTYKFRSVTVRLLLLVSLS